jgi:hypothetical protein
MDIDWAHELDEQLRYHWEQQLRPRFDGLTDEEYLWEPVAGCWSVRPRHEARTPMAAGGGDVVADFAFPEPSPPPFTTIAWRMAHLSVGVFGMRASNHFGDGSLSYQNACWELSAASGLAMLDRAYEAWTTPLRRLTAADLAKPCGPSEGPWQDASFAALVLHINREAIHHGAEIALLRDLYANRGG